MEQENDYIKREIQKLTLILMKLIDKTVSADINTFKGAVFETNEKLNEYFGLSLNEISTLENSKFIEIAERLHEVHIEKFIELLYKTIQKSEEFDAEFDFEIKALSNKLLLIIVLANEKSKSFSIERMNIKKQTEIILKNK